MAKRKIVVKFNGKIIGTRTTDRLYTHALVLVDFDPAVARARDKVDWLVWGLRNAGSGHAHAIEASKPTYRYASVVSEKDRACYAATAALPVEEYISQTYAAHLQRLEEYISKCIPQGPAVLSYPTSRDLAFKAQSAASKNYPEYRVLVEPVEV